MVDEMDNPFTKEEEEEEEEADVTRKVSLLTAFIKFCLSGFVCDDDDDNDDDDDDDGFEDADEEEDDDNDDVDADLEVDESSVAFPRRRPKSRRKTISGAGSTLFCDATTPDIPSASSSLLGSTSQMLFGS